MEFLVGVMIGAIMATFIWIVEDIKHSEDNE